MSNRAREAGRANFPGKEFRMPGKEFRMPYKQGGHPDDLVQVSDSIQSTVFDRSL